jgi:hypothetical protein
MLRRESERDFLAEASWESAAFKDNKGKGIQTHTLDPISEFFLSHPRCQY